MGLFDSIKKTKKSEWNVNKRPTLIDLTDTHIHCTGAAKEFDIFYTDIRNIKKELYVIKLETSVEKYELTPRKIRGAKDLANKLYEQLVEKISESKKGD